MLEEARKVDGLEGYGMVMDSTWKKKAGTAFERVDDKGNGGNGEKKLS